MTTELRIQTVSDDKRRFMDLLLIGDEQESMIDRYLDRGEMYVGIHDNTAICVCVVTTETGFFEIKNLAVDPRFQRKGYGRMMLEEIKRIYSGHKLLVGTGETPSTLQFYNKCGFVYSHRITDFFTINYNHIIIEDDIILKDMIYLKSDNTATNHVTTPKR